MVRYKKFSGSWRLSGLPPLAAGPGRAAGFGSSPFDTPPCHSLSSILPLTVSENRETFSAPGYAFPVIHAMLAGGVRSHLIGRETLKRSFKQFIDSHFIPWHCLQVGVAADRSLAREIRRARGTNLPPAPSSPQPGSNEVKEGSPLSTNYQHKAHRCARRKVRSISHFETPKCWYCGCALDNPIGFNKPGFNTFTERTRDHMTPISRGGTEAPENIVDCCRPCNSKKSKRTVSEYREYLCRKTPLGALHDALDRVLTDPSIGDEDREFIAAFRQSLSPRPWIAFSGESVEIERT